MNFKTVYNIYVNHRYLFTMQYASFASMGLKGKPTMLLPNALQIIIKKSDSY